MPLVHRFGPFYPAPVDTAWFLILGGTIKNTAVKTFLSRDTFALGRPAGTELRGKDTRLPNAGKHRQIQIAFMKTSGRWPLRFSTSVSLS